MTFGMAPWHICEDVDKQKSKEALHESMTYSMHSRLVDMIHALGIAYSRDCS